MNISPQRRNRIRRAHQLRQQGHTLRSIAQQLGVSHPTIIDDLALLETDRIPLTLTIIHDLLIAHSLDLHDRVNSLIRRDPLQPLTRFSAAKPDGEPVSLDAEAGPEQIARFEALHDRALNNALREFRLALRELDRATTFVKNQPADFPPEQLAAPDLPTPTKPDHDQPPQPTDPDLPTPTKPDHAQPPQPTAPDLPTPTKPDHAQPPQLAAPDLPTPTKPDHAQPPQLAAPDLPTPTKPDHAQPPQPTDPDLPTPTNTDHAQPPQLAAPDLPTPTKPDHAQPPQPTDPDLPTPTTTYHDQPPRPDTEPPQSAGAPNSDQPAAQRLTFDQLHTILEADPPQIETLRQLLQHPERFPELPPELLQPMQRIIADALADPDPVPT